MVKTAGCGSVMRGFESHYPPHLLISVGVSPSGKATDSDSVMRRFESCYPSQKEGSERKLRVLYFSREVSIFTRYSDFSKSEKLCMWGHLRASESPCVHSYIVICGDRMCDFSIYELRKELIV